MCIIYRLGLLVHDIFEEEVRNANLTRRKVKAIWAQADGQGEALLPRGCHAGPC